MRMWNLNPELMCRKHLIAEHVEIHAAVGNLRHSGIWAKSLTKKGYLEPQNFLKRHNKLVNEMIKRGYNHKSPLDVKNVNLLKGKVDINKSLRDLKKRCKECKLNPSSNA